jgi:hypothetical protein
MKSDHFCFSRSCGLSLDHCYSSAWRGLPVCTVPLGRPRRSPLSEGIIDFIPCTFPSVPSRSLHCRACGTRNRRKHPVRRSTKSNHHLSHSPHQPPSKPRFLVAEFSAALPPARFSDAAARLR